MQIYTKFSNFTGLYFPHFTTIRNQTLQFYSFYDALSSYSNGLRSSCPDQNFLYSWNHPLRNVFIYFIRILNNNSENFDSKTQDVRNISAMFYTILFCYGLSFMSFFYVFLQLKLTAIGETGVCMVHALNSVMKVFENERDNAINPFQKMAAKIVPVFHKI